MRFISRGPASRINSQTLAGGWAGEMLSRKDGGVSPAAGFPEIRKTATFPAAGFPGDLRRRFPHADAITATCPAARAAAAGGAPQTPFNPGLNPNPCLNSNPGINPDPGINLDPGPNPNPCLNTNPCPTPNPPRGDSPGQPAAGQGAAFLIFGATRRRPTSRGASHRPRPIIGFNIDTKQHN